MWVFEEIVNGEKLSDIINTKHENVKYLPGEKIKKCPIQGPVVGKQIRITNKIG